MRRKGFLKLVRYLPIVLLILVISISVEAKKEKPQKDVKIPKKDVFERGLVKDEIT
jgi:hypothetical protein